MKKCSSCQIELEESSFYKGYRNCKNCHKLIVKNYRKNNPKKVAKLQREINIKNNYGVTQADYKNLLDKQNNKCAICKSSEIGRKGAKFFNIDHCHKNKNVRGLLCHNCNTVLGKINDNKEWLKQALVYLD